MVTVKSITICYRVLELLFPVTEQCFRQLTMLQVRDIRLGAFEAMIGVCVSSGGVGHVCRRYQC